MTKEQRNLLQGVKVGSVVAYTNFKGYDDMGRVSYISFVGDSAFLTIVNIFGENQEIVNINSVYSIITNKRITKYYGVK